MRTFRKVEDGCLYDSTKKELQPVIYFGQIPRCEWSVSTPNFDAQLPGISVTSFPYPLVDGLIIFRFFSCVCGP